jgi:predicted naringenin-chalcone synthase
MTDAYINRIATAVPDCDVHTAFVDFAYDMLAEERSRNIFQRMAGKAAIHHRFSFIQTNGDTAKAPGVSAEKFYRRGDFPGTARRMEIFERFAPLLARCALDKLALTASESGGISHVLVTCCTGLYAPGLDFEIVDHLNLDPGVERTMIGFMGCYAAINALKLARHIVRSESRSKVLVLNLELCTLHLQETQDLELVLSFLIFGDGCAASLISADPEGLSMDSFRAVLIPDTRDLITWKIRELGFDMLLSGRVPCEIGQALRFMSADITGCSHAQDLDLWAVHPGGRSVLDAVEQGLLLSSNALAPSRDVLARFGNMSSAGVMFVLERVLRMADRGQRGCAMSFGPGLTAETLLFHAA